jgi:hypothetical protein
MDLNVTMRFAMIKARQAAGTEQVSVESLYAELLSLYDRTAEEIARQPSHLQPVEDDLSSLRSFVSRNNIDLWPTLYTLKEALAIWPSVSTVPKPDPNLTGILAKADKLCRVGGRESITAGDALEAIWAAPTPLMELCLVKTVGLGMTKVLASVRGADILRQRLGLDTPPQEKTGQSAGTSEGGAPTLAETAFQEVISTHIPADSQAISLSEPVSSEPEPQVPSEPVPTEPVPSESVHSEPVPTGPAPGESAPSKPSPSETRVKVSDFSPSSKYLIPAKFFLWPLVFLTLSFIAWMLYGNRFPFDNPWRISAAKITEFFWAAAMAHGYANLLGRLSIAVQIFLKPFIWTAMVYLGASALSEAAGRADLPMFAKIIVALFGLPLILLAARRASALGRALGQSPNSHAEFKLITGGTPSVLFIGHFLGSLLIPGLLFSIFWIWNIPVTKFWKSVFFIVGLLWGFYAIRAFLSSWRTAYADDPSAIFSIGYRINTFLSWQYYILFPPVFSGLLLWYFHCFPVKTWIGVLYCLYGFSWALFFLAGVADLTKPIRKL